MQQGTSRNAVLIAVLALCVSAASAAAMSVRECGAVGDGKTDDSDAFRQALAGADGLVTVPAGTYLLNGVQMPEGTVLEGVGARSVITMPPDAECALAAGNETTISRLRFVGAEGDTASPIQKGIVKLAWVTGVSVHDVTVEGTVRTGVITDHADRFRVSDCRFRKVGIAIHIQFSSHGVVEGNMVEEAAAHGIQFWGNWQWERKDITDLAFIGNQVRNSGGGGIWGTGATRVTMVGNIIDGAGDVGLDYEWCDDSTISGNTVRDCANAGISLFYTCHNIAISGNSVVVTEAREGLHFGIWLTQTNREEFPGDTGHRLVSITGNTIRAEGTRRSGVTIGADALDVLLSSNLLENCDVLDVTGKAMALAPTAAP